ncbi:MAG: hypothetical protein OEZ68_21080 [Gammaproteobacteria bacterium]|nr:hypothetical protein [Gammaproteobacteria bacterium]MDH5803296.1 hypothetical protein [Gammaproteobacteria bacterium]
MQTLPVSLTHIASLIFSAAVLLLHPQFAGIVLFLAGFNLSFTLISVVGLGLCYIKGHFPSPAGPFNALMGTHFGSMLCYIITINYAIHYSSNHS